MQAIILDRGRQYVVNSGDRLRVDRLPDVEPGAEHVFDQVLVMGEQIGTPFVEGAVVKATVAGEVLGKKIYVQKFKRRKDYRRRTGHRQRYTELTISSIEGA